MKKIFTLLSLTAFAFFVSIDSSQAQKETRDVDSFNKISFGISGNLYIKQGNTQSLVLEGDDLDDIKTEVSNGKLRIKNKNSGWNWHRERVDVYITVRDLEGISLSGSGKVIGENTFKTGDLELSVSGSGEMELDIESDDVESGISGSGEIELTGMARTHHVSISGSGKLRADDLRVETYNIHISGSGSCRIYASKEIDASVSGSGSIYYKGDPDKVYSKASGSGKLRKIN